MTAPFVVALTGASGAVYAKRLLEVLLQDGHPVHLTFSHAAQVVWEHELSTSLQLDAFESSQLRLDVEPNRLRNLSYHHCRDFMAPIASGSFLTRGMIVCPCSGGTLSGIVHGSSGNLIHRAADVHLKERRKLILVPRETPLSLVHLENMKRACEVGAVVLPAMPGWYHGVKTLADLVDFVVARILDQLGMSNALVERWGEAAPGA